MRLCLSLSSKPIKINLKDLQHGRNEEDRIMKEFKGTSTSTVFSAKTTAKEASDLLARANKIAYWRFGVFMGLENREDVAQGALEIIFGLVQKSGSVVVNQSFLKLKVMQAATLSHKIPKNYGKKVCSGVTECLECNTEFDWSGAKWEIKEWTADSGKEMKESRAFCPECGARLVTSRYSTMPKVVDIEVRNEDGDIIGDRAPATESCEQQTINRLLVTKLLKVACPEIQALLIGHLEGRPALTIAKELGISEAKLSEIWGQFRVQASRLARIKLEKSAVMSARAEKRLTGGLLVGLVGDPEAAPAAPVAQEISPALAAAEAPETAPSAVKKVKAMKAPKPAKSELEHLQARAKEYAGSMFSLDELFSDEGLALLNAGTTAAMASMATNHASQAAPQVSA